MDLGKPEKIIEVTPVPTEAPVAEPSPQAPVEVPA